ncbi:MAG: flagellar basal body-associated FliL family protein [Eubacteriales bacterium]|jgi:flagellar FliL protein
MARRKKEQDERETTKEERKQKPPKIKLFIAAGLVLSLIAGSAAYIYFNQGMKSKIAGLAHFHKQDKKNSENKSEKNDEEIVTLPSLVVNLSGGEKHFVRVSCVLVFSKSNKKLAQELEEKNYVLSDTLIESLREKSAKEIQSDPASKALKENLRQAINTKLTAGQISGVFFTELLVQ